MMTCQSAYIWFAGSARLPVLFTAGSGFYVTQGTISEVKSEWESHMEGNYAGHRVFEIRFAYSYAGEKRISDAMSPACLLCPGEDVVRILGMRPSSIVPGQPVKVFVMKADPSVAFLEPPSMQMLLENIVVLLIFAVLMPAGAYFTSGFFLKRAEMGETDRRDE